MSVGTQASPVGGGPAAAAGAVTGAPRPRHLRLLYLVEGMTSAGTNLLFVGIFFYTHSRFRWNLAQNFLLAGGQGITYVLGALSAHPLSRRFDRRANMAVLLALMALCAGVALVHPDPRIVTVVLLLYAGISAAFWPMVESLVSDGADAHALSRRIGTYNLIWSGVGVIAIAVNGAIIQYFPVGVFLIPVAAHGGGAILLLRDWMRRRHAVSHPGAAAAPPTVVDPLLPSPAAHPQPECQLLAVRELALWLSRISLPATFCVIYSLMALLPSLSLIRALPLAGQTLVSSTWMAARFAAFVILGATVWWHARPRALLVAAMVMLAAFLGCTIRLSGFPGAHQLPLAVDLIWFCAWQIALGLAMGLIYSASLYFGMVLSDGSTEHGGYHEALIGIGQVLGPGVGVLTQTLWPNSVPAGVVAISIVLAASIAAAATKAVGRAR